ncbi:hypothetical protein DACRYDRAFT_97194 [Dacryopinax primogenitus]|uniref:HMG box domain-containing protein n=1 Tax=Dacryopinax primogenitus (strain DJM 731) TaxID=1858805 RepID=M5FPW9_DACPD|nr:uncharacterized protein DACRYDRAFT_97194 [Dacryopinax primogenitus]EJT97373.1 hypothetical protein DACRYDRAFT_97194 [Dacryopinax primogenitus]
MVLDIMSTNTSYPPNGGNDSSGPTAGTRTSNQQTTLGVKSARKRRDDHFDPSNYNWEFRPPGLHDVQRLVDIVNNNNSEEDSDSDEDDLLEEIHIKRIPNKFFVYRSHFLRAYRNVVDPSSGQEVRPVPQRYISKLAGHVWKQVLTEAEREPYHLAYLQLKREFEAAHPDYHYRPRTRLQRESEKDLQNQKRAEETELKRLEKREREEKENRLRISKGYSHRAWRKLKADVRSGKIPDPCADVGGCITQDKIKKPVIEHQPEDNSLILPNVSGPVVPEHSEHLVLPTVHLLTSNVGMRASMAWKMTEKTDNHAEHYDSHEEYDTEEEDQDMEYASDEPVEEPYRKPAPVRADYEVQEIPAPLPLPSTCFAESSTRGRWPDAQEIPPPRRLFYPRQPTAFNNIGPVRSLLPEVISSMNLKQLEDALIATSLPELLEPLEPVQAPPPVRPVRPAIEFGRVNPAQLVFSTGSETSSAKRRMVMYDTEPEPRSIRDEPDDPVRGPVDIDCDGEENTEFEVDVVRDPIDFDMDERMAPPTGDEDPYQVFPPPCRTNCPPGSGQWIPGGESLDRSHVASNSKAPLIETSVTNQHAMSVEPMMQEDPTPVKGKGKRRLSEGEEGRSRQPSIAVGHMASPRTPRSRQPSIVVGLVNGAIELISQEELERLEDLERLEELERLERDEDQVVHSRGSTSGSSGSTSTSTSTSPLSEPSEAITELLSASSFDTPVTSADAEEAYTVPNDDGKHFQAYHWFGQPLDAVLDGAAGVDARGPRMSFSDLITPLPDHLTQEGLMLQNMQNQINQVVEQGDDAHYNSWTMSLEDVGFDY